MTRGAAQAFVQHLNNAPAKQPPTITSASDLAVLRRLEHRGIATGLVEAEEPWSEKVLRVLREDREYQERYQAEKAQREAEEAEAQLTTAQKLTRAIGGQETGRHLPLNGAALLRQVISGISNSTINGQEA